MKVEFSIATNMQGSRVTEVFDVTELTGLSSERIEQMPAIYFDNLLSDEWRAWVLDVTDGGWHKI